VVLLVKTEDETEPEEMLASEVGPAVEADGTDDPLDDWMTGTEVEAAEFTKPLDEAELDKIADVVSLKNLLDVAVLLLGAALVELLCLVRD